MDDSYQFLIQFVNTSARIGIVEYYRKIYVQNGATVANITKYIPSSKYFNYALIENADGTVQNGVIYINPNGGITINASEVNTSIRGGCVIVYEY